MKSLFTPLVNLALLQALVKGFSIFYFVLLPVFYAQKFITVVQLGYIGALFIMFLIIGAVVVARWLHKLKTKNLIQLASCIALFSSFMLFFYDNLFLLLLSYSSMGLAAGIGLSGVNAVAAHITTRGDRYQALSQIGILMDVLRILFPIFVSGAIVAGSLHAAFLVIVITTILVLAFSFRIPQMQSTVEDIQTMPTESIRKNKNFLYVLRLEFLDSFSSGQLFVFLPLLFLAKGYSLENSILLQSFIFLGYLSGRLLMGSFAKRYSGIKTVAYAEIGMVISIILLLVFRDLWVLYVLSFLLGIFARSTSPIIKALAFDSLSEYHMKKGSAIHVVAGDSGAALGQLLFGFFVAWFGVTSPFIVASFVALFIAIICLAKPIHLKV